MKRLLTYDFWINWQINEKRDIYLEQAKCLYTIQKINQFECLDLGEDDDDGVCVMQAFLNGGWSDLSHVINKVSAITPLSFAWGEFSLI